MYGKSEVPNMEHNNSVHVGQTVILLDEALKHVLLSLMSR